MTRTLLLTLFLGCGDAQKDTATWTTTSEPTDTATETDTDPQDTDTTPSADQTGNVGVVEVPPTGPYGTHTFEVEARANWVNTGLFLAAGETATLTASGTWTVEGVDVGPDGDGTLGTERGCNHGALVARSGLRFEDTLICIGSKGTVTAATDDILYVGMAFSSDLGETYGDRNRLDGSVEVTVTSDHDTVPTIADDYIATYDFDAVASGWVEVSGEHNTVTIEAAQVTADRDTAAASLQTLDEVYDLEAQMRGMTPFSGQRVRWYPDETIPTIGAYMLAGNPMRCDPATHTGTDDQRILRSSVETNDIWGFAHELGHAFTMPNGTWTYMLVNIESWPNIFTLHALEGLGRTKHHHNALTYCDSENAYLAAPDYDWLADDPFLQLCFLMAFEDTYGPGFYETFFPGMNDQTNEDMWWDGTDTSVWTYVMERFDLAAGEPTRELFETWSVPVW